MDSPRLSAACASLALHAATLTAVLAAVLTPPVLQAPQPLEVSLIAPLVPLPAAKVSADTVPPAPARAVPPPASPSPRQASAPRLPRPHLAAPASRPAADEPPLRPPAREPAAETAPAPAAPTPTVPRDSAISQPTAETPTPAGPAIGAPTTGVAAAGGPVAAARTATQPAGPARSGPRVDASWAGNTPPPYPGMAMRMGEQGEVRLDVRVGVDGRVTEIRLRQSSGSALLDRTAIETVKKWRFNPATVDGRPVAEWYHDWRWVFRLEG